MQECTSFMLWNWIMENKMAHYQHFNVLHYLICNHHNGATTCTGKTRNKLEQIKQWLVG